MPRSVRCRPVGTTMPDVKQQESFQCRSRVQNYQWRCPSWVNDIKALPSWFLPDGPREQTKQGLYAAYRGFIGADSWDLDGGPKKESMAAQRAGGGGGDTGGG